MRPRGSAAAVAGAAGPPVTRRSSAALSLVCRLGFRLAYRTLRIWWLVRRPSAEGAGVAVWAEGKLLVLRTSYRPGLDLPAGGVARGESPLEGALRELREETGIAVEARELGRAIRLRFAQDHRRITATIFEWRPPLPPLPRVDDREIVCAAYRDPVELRAAARTELLSAYLGAVAGAGPGHATPSPTL
jgi:8-oxo-dGTP pyrophosphatase MutT (NUDIX family)